MAAKETPGAPQRWKAHTHVLKVGRDEASESLESIEIATLPAWHMSDMPAPHGAAGLFERLFDPDFDDERMCVRLVRPFVVAVSQSICRHDALALCHTNPIDASIAGAHL